MFKRVKTKQNKKLHNFGQKKKTNEDIRRERKIFSICEKIGEYRINSKNHVQRMTLKRLPEAALHYRRRIKRDRGRRTASSLKMMMMMINRNILIWIKCSITFKWHSWRQFFIRFKTITIVLKLNCLYKKNLLEMFYIFKYVYAHYLPLVNVMREKILNCSTPRNEILKNKKCK